MARSVTRFAAVAALSAAALVTPGVAAASAPGLGTFTQITSPAKTLHYNYTIGAVNKLQVAGRTSLDVTQVDIDCVTYIFSGAPQVEVLASAVPVSAGSFSVEASFSFTPDVECRLMAVPDGVDTDTDYLGSFTGPILELEALGLARAGNAVYSYTAFAELAQGTALLTDVGTCGTEALVTVEAPQMLAGPIMISCLFSLSATNFGPSGQSTRSTIQIDGHNAYLPSGVRSYLIGHLSLPVAQSALTVRRSIAHNGNVTLTESAPLMRCDVADTYPPTTTSCSSLVPTGVRYQRVTTVGSDGHQVQLRDTFTSTDHHAHTASLEYQAVIANQSGSNTATGNVGYAFPGHGSAFHPGNLGQTITHLGSKAATILIRSDLHALPTDGAADTMAGTWSRAPSKVTFGTGAPNELQLPYSLRVPAGHSAFTGFAISERWTTAEVKPLAAAGAAAFVATPGIAAPHRGATVHGTSVTVKGSLVAGANGLPASVRVNGHSASIHVTSDTRATYKVKVHEPAGRHTITVVATDAAGNSASASTTVRNT